MFKTILSKKELKRRSVKMNDEATEKLVVRVMVYREFCEQKLV